MNYKQISLFLGKYLFFFSLILLLPLGVALYYDFVADSKFYPQAACIACIFFYHSHLPCPLPLLFFGGKRPEKRARKKRGHTARRSDLAYLLLGRVASLSFHENTLLSHRCLF